MDLPLIGLILVSSILVNNYVLIQFLGLCPFIGVSDQVETAVSMCFATTFVLTLSASLSYLSYQYVLLPLEVPFLKTLMFILSIAASVQLTELFIRYYSPLLHQVMGIFLPLITSNCAVLGIALLNVNREVSSVFEAALYGFGAAIGFSLVLILMAGLRERIATADVPAAFQGAPIGLITAGLMALAFSGFTGMSHI